MFGTDVQLTATDSQEGPVGELLTIQLHLNKVVLSSVWVLDTNL